MSQPRRSRVLALAASSLVVLAAGAVAPATAAAASDLSMIVQAQGSFTVGSTETFSLQVKNNGPDASSSTVSVTDTLPDSLVFVSAAGDGWTCGQGQTFTCTSTAAIAASGLSSIVTVTVRPNAPGTAVNSATVSSADDANGANDTDTATVGVAYGQDTSIVVQPKSSPFEVDREERIELDVRGSRADEGELTTVTGSLPDGLTFVSVAGVDWSCGQGQTFTCTSTKRSVSELAVTVRPTAAAVPSVTVTATVSVGGDENPGNDTAAATVAVVYGRDRVVSLFNPNLLPSLVVGRLSFVKLDVDDLGKSRERFAAPTTLSMGDTAALDVVAGFAPGWVCGPRGALPCTAAGSAAATARPSDLRVAVRPTAAAVPSAAVTVGVESPGDQNPTNNLLPLSLAVTTETLAVQPGRLLSEQVYPGDTVALRLAEVRRAGRRWRVAKLSAGLRVLGSRRSGGGRVFRVKVLPRAKVATLSLRFRQARAGGAPRRAVAQLRVTALPG